MSFPRYPQYKDSGVCWLGEVPLPWDIKKIRWLCEIKKRIAGELGYDVLSITQQGIRVRDLESNDGQLSMDYSKYQLVEVGDFAMNHMDLLTGYVDISERQGVTSPDYRVFSIRNASNCHDKFLLYLFQMGYRNKIFYAYGQGSSQLGRWRLPTEQFNELPCPLPSIGEQKAIAAFLDRETAKIDALVAEQEKLIALLKEKRQAVISHAVTKGLNPDAPMKDSGVEWLGEVPAHWETWKVSHAFGAVGSGTTPPSDEPQWYAQGSIPWVTTGELRENVVFETAKSVTQAALEKFTSLRLHPAGSLAIAMYGATIGRLGILGVAATTNQACCVLSSPLALDVHFVFFWLCGFKKNLIDLYASGGGQPNINQDIVAGLRIPSPSLPEQRAIAAFLDIESAKVDALIVEAEKGIALLKERRSALISAAVTGKIDVRGIAAEREAA